jgi:hypothetical protein
MGFKKALRARPDHALAYYYSHKCHEELGNAEESVECLAKARECAANPFWQKYVRLFELPL